MKDKSRYGWDLVFTLGHKYFICRNTGKIAVVDDSSVNPPLAVEKLIFLDEYRPIVMNEVGLWDIPIRHPGGKQTTTPAHWHEVVVLAYSLRKMRVEHEETIIPISSRIDELRPREFDD